MSKRMLADVLWEAANRVLDHDGTALECAPLEHFSCCAVARVLNPQSDYLPQAIDVWLTKLGCNTGTDGFAELATHGPSRQGLRYMWLLLAMHVAEDEGIEV